MNQKITKLNKKANEIMGRDADFIIIAQKDGQCGGSAHGDSDRIAQAIFALLHSGNEELAKAVYRIIKLNVMNILSNESPYAADLADAIYNVMPKDDE